MSSKPRLPLASTGRSMTNMAAPVRPQPGQQRRSSTTGLRPSQTSITSSSVRSGLPLDYINEVHDFSLEEYLSHSPDLQPTAPSVSITHSPALGPGEMPSQDFSYLAATRQQNFNWQTPHSPASITSDAGLTTASTATSAPMSRCNTSDILCEPFNMIRVDSNMSRCDISDISDSTTVGGCKASQFGQNFPTSHLNFSSESCFSQSQSQSSFPEPSLYAPFSPSTEMKHSPSQESYASSSSSQSLSRMSRRVQEQNAQSKARPLAPKMESSESSSSDEMPMQKFVEVTSDDGTIRHKAEIPRTTRQQPQRKTTFCTMCSDHPQGFHGDHELRRHRERHHATYRKVWICKDNSTNGEARPVVPLANCKACRNDKTYGANYNAAAHLRRAHFYPCKNKRGGRGKISEGRGGMGGGEKPPMEELKNWMFEQWEINIGGDLVLQNAEPTGEFSGFDADEAETMLAFNQFDDTAAFTEMPFDISQDLTQSFDSYAVQYPLNTTSNSYPYANFNDGVVEQTPFVLHSQHHQTFNATYTQ